MNRSPITRRRFVGCAAGSLLSASGLSSTLAQEHRSDEIRVLNPLGRVPLSFVIDDSTCLVNMGHFGMPQFAEAWPDREIYKQPWKDWPREIPDSFVREFGEWCAEQGVKGKYSIVPYPACVGWLDRGLPGWSRRELNDSLNLVRELMVPNWDIHPEMITHTRVIDLKTGRPMSGANSATMENSYPQQDVSVDYLASYLAYALRILKNCGLPCEGITTPGGFGGKVKAKLPLAVHQSVRDVFGIELPHYFKYVITGAESTRPKLEYTSETKSIDNLTMNVPAGTGDWFGGWEGTRESEGFRYANEDASAGRMVELIQRGEPAVMLCHWPGMYCNGQKTGFEDFKRVVLSLAARFGERTIWMKLSEIGCYEAAKALTRFRWSTESRMEVSAPLSCSKFTISCRAKTMPAKIELEMGAKRTVLQRVASPSQLTVNSYVVDGGNVTLALDLPAGDSTLLF